MDNIEIRNAVIKSVSLSSDDHGCLSAWVSLEYSSGGQGFGGYALYLPPSSANHKIQSVAGHFIFRVMEVAGVTNWDKVAGKTVRVEADRRKVHAIGHILNDDWFRPSVDFKEVPVRLKIREEK